MSLQYPIQIFHETRCVICAVTKAKNWIRKWKPLVLCHSCFAKLTIKTKFRKGQKPHNAGKKNPPMPMEKRKAFFVPCIVCRKDVLRYPSTIINITFCTRKCRGQYMLGKDLMCNTARPSKYKGTKRDPKIVEKIRLSNTGQKRSAAITERLSAAQRQIWSDPVYHMMQSQAHMGNPGYWTGKDRGYKNNAVLLAQLALARTKNKSKDNKIEIKMQDALSTLGISFIKHDSELPGTPDIRLLDRPVIIFCDGDRYHASEQYCKKYRLTEDDKILGFTVKAKREYDAKITGILTELGYTVIRLWEHDINKRPVWCINQILQAIGKPIPILVT